MFQLTNQQKFVFVEVSVLAWGASVQRANLYNPQIKFADRDTKSFRAAVMQHVETRLIPNYLKPCAESDPEH